MTLVLEIAAGVFVAWVIIQIVGYILTEVI